MRAEVASLRAVLSMDEVELDKKLKKARDALSEETKKRPIPDWLKPGAPMPPKGSND